MKQKVKNYMTPFGFNKLFSEQQLLLTDERPKMVDVVSWAASLGDRSENADYIYGKKRLREIDRRLRFLAKRLDNAEIVNPLDIQSEKVQFGASVEIEDEQGDTKTYHIVGEDETEPGEGIISWKSPIGRSLLGKEVGDEIEVRVPKGILEFEILGIEYSEIPFTIDSQQERKNDS